MNLGSIMTTKSGKHAYIKLVDWNKAVLWKDRQISISPMAVRLYFDKAELVIFIDKKKGKCWYADIEDVKNNWIMKKEGQEKQYYLNINLLKERIICSENQSSIEKTESLTGPEWEDQNMRDNLESSTKETQEMKQSQLL